MEMTCIDVTSLWSWNSPATSAGNTRFYLPHLSATNSLPRKTPCFASFPLQLFKTK